MTTQTTQIPAKQYAIQLVGKSELKLNNDKDVFKPGPFQILAKVEAVGLCFSDLKLLKQFNEHPRKGVITKGLDLEALKEIPSYVPDGNPTVPGHEAVCRIVAIGEKVKHHKLGERCLVQTDYRDLLTAGSNGAFGYNFEGALQEYVLMDERVVIDPRGERYLIPAQEDLGASAVALVEPWACVEDSYVTHERQTIKAGGRLVVMAEAGAKIQGVAEAFAPQGKPAELIAIVAEPAQLDALKALGVPVTTAANAAELANESCDDIVYFGADAATLEVLNDKLTGRGIINIVLAGKTIGKEVSVGVGRVHYGMTRWIGTASADAADAYRVIPATGELREGDKILVVGAGGPMGQMHVIRAACAGLKGLEVVSTDFDQPRLDSLAAKAQGMADANGVGMRYINTQHTAVDETFTYIALMAPIGALVADAIVKSTPGCLINIFAGIPAPTRHNLDLDTYIANRCFMFGTSGSAIEDMKIVLGKVTRGQLDTNLSVDAISGMAGAIEGLAAVENRTLAGKIIVYPMLHEIGLIPLEKLAERFPTVAAKLDNGHWCKAAEQELLAVAAPAA